LGGEGKPLVKEKKRYKGGSCLPREGLGERLVPLAAFRILKFFRKNQPGIRLTSTAPAAVRGRDTQKTLKICSRKKGALRWREGEGPPLYG